MCRVGIVVVFVGEGLHAKSYGLLSTESDLSVQVPIYNHLRPIQLPILVLCSLLTVNNRKWEQEELL